VELGAEARLLQLVEEAAKIFSTFPALRSKGFMAKTTGGDADPAIPFPKGKRKRTMSAPRESGSRMPRRRGGRNKRQQPLNDAVSFSHDVNDTAENVMRPRVVGQFERVGWRSKHLVWL
jgi:hypothetical protein